MAKRPKDPNAPSRQDANDRITAAVREENRKARLEKLLYIGLPLVLVIVAGTIFFLKRGGEDTVVPGKGDKTYEALVEIGVNPQISGCSEPTSDPTPKEEKILPAGEKFSYPKEFIPPSSGPFAPQPADINEGGFYTADDRPPVEALVGNLNAGWSVVWFDAAALGPRQRELIAEAAGILRKDPRYSQFVAVEWDSSYGKLPDEGPIVLTRWVKGEGEAGHRSYCNQVSGEVFRQWMALYGAARIPGIDLF